MLTEAFVTRFVRYFITGGISALVDWSLFWVMTQYLGIYYLSAALLSFCISFVVNYILSRYWVFGPGVRAMAHEATLVLFVSIMGLCFHMAVLWMLVEWVSLPEMLSKIIATGVVFFWNFGARQYWVFSHPQGSAR
jgi:putative flippase GtrA